MPTVVVFTRNNARIIHNPENLDELRANPNCVVDPDLSLVRRLPPHFWKLDGGHVVPMILSEREAVLAHHEVYGVDNEHPASKTRTVPQEIKHQKKMSKVRLALSVAMGGGVVELAHWLAHHL